MKGADDGTQGRVRSKEAAADGSLSGDPECEQEGL